MLHQYLVLSICINLCVCVYVCACLQSTCMHSMSFQCTTWSLPNWQNSRRTWQNVRTRQIARCSRQHDLQWYAVSWRRLFVNHCRQLIRYVCVTCASVHLDQTWGTGIRGLMRGMANLPQGNKELLVVRHKVGRPPGELEQVHWMWYFPFIALTLLVGWQEGHPACKNNWVLVCWWWWFDWSFTTCSSSCHHHLHHPLLH